MLSSKYSQRGVSSQKEDVHRAIQKLDKGLFPNAFCKILPDFAGNDERFCNIMHADTAGTKSVLAYLYWKETGDNSVWKSIAQDALVMNLDDMACVGAVGDLVISSTIGRNKHLVTGEVLQHLIEGAAELLEEWRSLGIKIHSAGGETADVGDVVRTVDVGFTAFTRMERKNVLEINLQPGDVIVGFASFGKATYENESNSGIGCNGLTSARHDVLAHEYYQKYPESYDRHVKEELLYAGSKKLTDIEPETGLTIGKLLLSPTRTYFPVIQKIFAEKIKISGMIHCTGGGQTKVLKFADKVKIIKDNLFEPPPVFKLIQAESGTDLKEMYEVFNMGQRLEVYTDEQSAQRILEISKSFAVEAKITGRVESSDSTEIVIKNGQNAFVFSKTS